MSESSGTGSVPYVTDYTTLVGPFERKLPEVVDLQTDRRGPGDFDGVD